MIPYTYCLMPHVGEYRSIREDIMNRTFFCSPFAAIPLCLSAAIAQVPVNSPTIAHALPMTTSEQQNTSLALDWWRIVIDAGHLEKAPKYMAENYVQHNPNISTGRRAFLEAFSQGNVPTNPIPAKLASPPVLAAGRGQFVWFLWEGLHKRSTSSSEAYYANEFELLRISNGKIQEHWDTAHKEAGTGLIKFGVTPRPLLEFDDTELCPAEIQVRAIAVKAGSDVYLNHDASAVAGLFADDYLEHDPNIAKVKNHSRRAALGSFLSSAKPPRGLEGANPSVTVVNGEYVLMMWRVSSEDPDDKARTYPWSYFQLIRVHGRKVVEHWDQERIGKALLY